MSAEIRESGDPEPPVWPDDQQISQIDSTIAVTRFEDMLPLHEDLIDYLVGCEQEMCGQVPKQTAAAGGTKIHHVDSWQVPGARLLDQRAQMLYRKVVGRATSAVDLSWANVYRAGDYILPHAHRRSEGSVVYMLSLGETDEADPMTGRFGFADPRLPLCCSAESDIMTTPHFPQLRPGAMLAFPSRVVHLATPYIGQSQPRITLSWNINSAPLPSRPPDDAARGISPHPGRT